ncbi:hypothetical protein Mal15_63300 [Stieleria maiorica]|uniref:Uncharacterized protein n=1 Tax=Stieleria maiorica TaxID=2795974 RepID=A0A5B9MMS4_9BACT|nr:hypothetical protein Mal15_63300 [Stieleria maiorica]
MKCIILRYCQFSYLQNIPTSPPNCRPCAVNQVDGWQNDSGQNHGKTRRLAADGSSREIADIPPSSMHHVEPLAAQQAEFGALDHGPV